MEYILHFSGETPPYVDLCIQNIKDVDPSANIIFCTDTNYKNKNVQTINLNEITNQLIKDVENLNYFDKDSSPLWRTSLLRIFYLLSAAQLFSIKEFVHFDTDVLIYKSHKELKKEFETDKLNITPEKENSLVFGYSFISGLSNYEKVCLDIYEIMKDSKYYERRFFNNTKLNEMMILNLALIKNPKYFNLLPTTPNKKNSIIFDPNSYGQYLGGIDNKFLSKKTINASQYSGRAMLKEGFRPKFNKGKPYIKYEGKKVELANLHIHKKNLNLMFGM